MMPKELILTVEDEGIGFNEGSAHSQGIKSMRKRLSEIRAELEIDSRENEGTLVTITLPL
jgi:signal transduction histidine kinase